MVGVKKSQFNFDIDKLKNESLKTNINRLFKSNN